MKTLIISNSVMAQRIVKVVAEETAINKADVCDSPLNLRGASLNVRAISTMQDHINHESRSSITGNEIVKEDQA